MVKANTKAHQILKTYGPEWSFLTEFPLSQFMQDRNGNEEPIDPFLFQAMRGLELTPDWIKNINMTLGRFANGELADIKQGKVEPSGSIRLFCQKKMINRELNGGWGYFLIERTGDSSASPSSSQSHFIDLYLYIEGE
jgi:hypothetical protein